MSLIKKWENEKFTCKDEGEQYEAENHLNFLPVNEKRSVISFDIGDGGGSRNLNDRMKKIGSLHSLTPTVFSVVDERETFKYSLILCGTILLIIVSFVVFILTYNFM